MTIKFGTDGWRAIIADEFTFENVAICVQGVAGYIKEIGLAARGMVVGYDTRFSSKEFATCAAEVLAGNGIPTLLCKEASPTPVVSYNVLVHKAAGAVVITASHNPPEWNGLKFKPDYGGSASSEIADRLEEHVARASAKPSIRSSSGQTASQSLISEIDPMPPYIEQIARMVDLNTIRDSGIKVVVDTMHGAGAGYLPMLLQGARGSVTEIRGEVNPAFPGMKQPEPIAENLAVTSELVVKRQADVGIAYDCDADRLGVIDEKGRYLNTLQVFALLALYLLEVKGERGPIVKSLTSSDMLFRLGELYGVPVLETGVGFKYAGPLMIKENALMAGEESGGYGFRGHIPERDGILSSLFLLEFMARTQMKPSELLQHLHDKVGEWHFNRRDIAFSAANRADIQGKLEENADVTEIAGMKITSTDAREGRRFRVNNGWLIVRFSGTEPLVRIYAEADTPVKVDALIDGATALLGI